MSAAKDRVIEAARAYLNSVNSLGRYDTHRRYELSDALAALDAAPDDDGGWRERLGFGEIVMMSEQRNQPGLPPRWCALARGRKEAAYADSEEEARAAALALPVTEEAFPTSKRGDTPAK